MIVLKNITKTYLMGDIEIHAVRDISLEIKSGEFVAIMGPSGSGKSTLMHILGCLDKPDSGEYLFGDTNIDKLDDDQLAYIRNQRIGFVFQTFNLIPRTSALRNVELPTIYRNLPEREEKVKQMLGSVGLADRMYHKPNELSGGQQQRVAIARALINNPSVLFADEPTGNLDSHSEKEIMDILQGLNKKGLTIILVTHEPLIAEYADRIIHIHDGRISSDERKKDRQEQKKLPVAAMKQNDNDRNVSWFNLREIMDSVRMAFDGLLANKMRSFLTMLGVIIGVGAVIAMISIVHGARTDITSSIESRGANLLMIGPGRARTHGSRTWGGRSETLKLGDAQAIAEDIPAVTMVSPEMEQRAQIVYGNNNANTRTFGVVPEYTEVRNHPVEEGYMFDYDAIQYRRMVAVIGRVTADQLFEEDDPLGKYIKINGKNFRVIGILKEKGGSGGWGNEDEKVLVPITTAQKRLFGVENLNYLNVQVIDAKSMNDTEEQIKKLLRKRHRIREGQEDDFYVRSQLDILETVKETTRTFSFLLGGIASVSLLVGGIGIMNIMLVSVTERTREVGLRKAVGARRRDILTQFLIEAVVLSIIGGAIGVLMGFLGSKLISKIGNWTTLVSSGSVILAFGFAFTVGIIFGLYPARKAATLNPIDALRYE